MSAPVLSTVLALVNRARVAQGREPIAMIPRGTRGNAFHCPLGKALECSSVGPGNAAWKMSLDGKLTGIELERMAAVAWKTKNSSQGAELPPALVTFVRSFDAGNFPELIETGVRP